MHLHVAVPLQLFSVWLQDGVAAGKQLLACINALPLCGGQTPLPTTQSFVGQLVALMLHLNRYSPQQLPSLSSV